MASILRLASKERSSFLFKRSSQQSTDNSQNNLVYDPDNDQLPNISHIDTASLFNLFDRYNTLEFSQSTSARDFAWPIESGTKSAPSLLYHSSPTNATTPAISNTDSSMVNVGRNDSTGSSTLSRRSSSTPPMTRHSSSSSVVPAISPLALKKSRTTPIEITALPDVGKVNSTSASPFRPQRQGRSNTGDSTTSSGSQRLNLDKPLPQGPPDQNNKYSNSSARRKHRRVDSLDSATLFQSANGCVELPTRFESLRKHARSTTVSIPLNGQPLPNPPTSPAPTSRGARLGKAMAQANTGAHLRSKSESLLEGIDTTKYKPQRSSAPVDLTKLAQKRHSLQKHAKKALSARTAEQVIYRIMCQLETPEDLQSAAMVSKGFLNTYQRNESNLVSHMIFQSSRPAWELRRSLITLKGSRTFKTREYLRDLRTIQAIKAFIADRCRTSCKAKTMAGLLGKDKECEREVENALWRVWTFCALFGDNASQNPIPAAELDWLNGSKGANSRVLGAGFAVGNGTGLTVDELEDMSEIWCCLQKLVYQFHGREDEADRAGVFDNWHLNQGVSAHQHITEWTAYILTLGPQVILSLSSGSFDRARILGLTKWTPPARGQSRAGFLTTAISQVYQERLLAEATAKAAQITLPSPRGHRPSKSLPDPSLLLASEPATIQQLRQPSLRIDTQSIHTTKLLPVSSSATVRASSPPVEIRPDCDPANDSVQPQTAHPRTPHTRSISTSAITPSSTFFPASPTADPTVYHSLNLTAPAHTASVKLGATLFPMEYAPATPRVPFLASPPPPTRAPPPPPIPAPGVKDPIDKAMDLLVKDLGFKENNAKRALAMCDSGSGIDVERAIELLLIESRREAMANATSAPIELPTPADIVSPLSTASSSTRRTRSKSDYCDGDCRRATTSGGSSLASVRGSIVKSRAGTVRSHVLTRNIAGHNANPIDEEDPVVEEAGNISPITDIYGGHSDGESESIPDDSSEMWRRKEGSDTISPLLTPMPFRSVQGQMQLQGQRKAWKVLGLPGQQETRNSPPSGIKGGLARMRSKSSGSGTTVVGIEEYALRVERKRSLRLVQAAEKERLSHGRGLGVVTAGLGESLRGLTGSAGPAERMSGGLGGFREVIPSSALGLGISGEAEGGFGRENGKEKEKEKQWGLKRGFSRKDGATGCLPQSPC